MICALIRISLRNAGNISSTSFCPLCVWTLTWCVLLSTDSTLALTVPCTILLRWTSASDREGTCTMTIWPCIPSTWTVVDAPSTATSLA